jgi:hypothetical protein
MHAKDREVTTSALKPFSLAVLTPINCPSERMELIRDPCSDATLTTIS